MVKRNWEVVLVLYEVVRDSVFVVSINRIGGSMLLDFDYCT